MGYYRHVAIESFRNPGEPSSASIRARPLPGQGFDRDMRVECSSKMRNNHPVGTIFIVQAQVIDKDGGLNSFTRITTGHIRLFHVPRLKSKSETGN